MDNPQSDIVNILIVDDRLDNLLALEAVLSDLGQNLVKADSGAAALRCLLKDDFAVILLDVQMPEMDGFETAALIRARERNHATPIIFLTAVSKSDLEVIQGYITGAVDYIFKPFDPTILKAKVQAFVDLYRMREQVQAQATQLRLYSQRLEAEIAERTRGQILLEAANKDLDAFARSVSHDLRAGLNHIEYFSKALADDAGVGLNEKARGDVARLQSSAQKMSELMDDLLKLSRVARVELRRAPVDLSALARQIIEDLRPLDPVRQVECVVADGMTASADPGLLRVVLENLIGNAWKYSSKRERARIEIGALPTNPDSETGIAQGAAQQSNGDPLQPIIRHRPSVFFVRDNGVGFNMEHAARLFTPFQRLPSASEFQGTGIGLSIVQSVIHRHGGRIWAEAQEGQGATFYFTVEPE